MQDIKLVYKGNSFKNISIKPINYIDDYFDIQIENESKLFYKLRKKNKIEPHKIKASSSEKIMEIREYFTNNQSTFYFLFQKNIFIGSILYIKNYINVVIVSKRFQRKGFGKELTKFAINKILDNNYNCVEIHVLEGNKKAYKLYKSLGFYEE